MTSTVLNKTLPTTLDANGNGLIVLRPDVGQNWAPLFVRVSTGSRATPQAYCALYHGSPGVPVQQSQFIDDTFTAAGDTSSIISGTPVVFGEALLFQFLAGSPGDTAIATVFGLQSDLPPNLDLVPQVPGTHFSGHLTTEVVSVLAKVSHISPVSLGPGLGVGLGGIFDVRNFASYNLSIYSTTVPSAPTAFNPVKVVITWRDGPGSNDNVTFVDTLEWWSDGGSGPFGFVNGLVYSQDTHHGSYFSVQVTNEAAADTVQISYTLTASTRMLPGPYVRQDAGVDGTIAHINNGAIGQNIPLPLHYGRLWARMTATGAGTTNFGFQMAGDSFVYELFPVNASTTTRAEWITPKRALLAQMSNATYTLFMHSLFDRS